ncbi:MAG: hypothetical protein COW47_01900 [Candidatus Huberarchaeum crystalense]|uniref:Uncharacterized protein n=1 Tax=Huberarchaeum crystalense TaxID=2014257 RepID=A0A2H9RCY0_HUBC1|nr:MAG: hypothetical protein COW47_01900 [Candidatus Huberarchaeum crystalense]PJC01262.1 MAG: hypothetical protein CO072_01800 [Candidatus Huberarchaeum crystalense]
MIKNDFRLAFDIRILARNFDIRRQEKIKLSKNYFWVKFKNKLKQKISKNPFWVKFKNKLN